MTGVLNPWSLLAGVLLILASFGTGVKVGVKWNEGEHLAAMAEQQKLTDAETERANQVAMIYGESLLTSQDTASKLRKELNDVRGKLTVCDGAGGVRFTPEFVGLRDAAMQADGKNTAKLAYSPAGASVTADELVENDIENGRRWKACRTQLNALIDILSTQPSNTRSD